MKGLKFIERQELIQFHKVYLKSPKETQTQILSYRFDSLYPPLTTMTSITSVFLYRGTVGLIRNSIGTIKVLLRGANPKFLKTILI